jgi:hypothetical protein
MDDERIRQLRDEVLAAIRDPGPRPPDAAALSARVAALEEAVRALQAAVSGPSVGVATAVAVARAAGGANAASGHDHPSLRRLDVPGGVDHCVLEPDKPCVESGRCRALGH